MADRSHEISRGADAGKPFPYLSGLNAHRMIELIALQLAPAATAAAMAYTHLDSERQGILVFASILGTGLLLRRPHFPLHLIPIASAALYLLTAPIGALAAVLISGLDQASTVTPDEMVAPVLGAWLVTGLGALMVWRFRVDREVTVAVIGSHEFARGLEAELTAVGIRGYRVVGCIDPERPCDQQVVAGVRCLGTLNELRGIVLSSGVELLVLGPLTAASEVSAEGRFQASGVSRLEVFERVADSCLDLPVVMIDAGQLYEDLFGHVPLGTTTAAWFQYLLHPRYRGASAISKRGLDLVLGTIAGLLALPLLAVAMAAILLTDGGPILHRQRRMGEAGKDLELVKLRTMRVDPGGPGWTADEDDRITPVGRVLRRLHIDELPQIWLVLKGEMSLVGPRPEQPAIVTELESRFSHYDRRHLVKPGITGWAQVRCGYSGSHIGSAWKLCHDLYYLKRRSVLFDVLIMLETLSTVFVSEPIKRPDERFIVGIRDEEDAAGVEAPVASQAG